MKKRKTQKEMKGEMTSVGKSLLTVFDVWAGRQMGYSMFLLGELVRAMWLRRGA